MAVYEDSATIYFWLRNVGGECFSTFSGVYLSGEAYPRWNPANEGLPRWTGSDNVRWNVVAITSVVGC